MADEVRVERAIGAPAEQVWAFVADVTRMPEWSPETVAVEWRGGATGPAEGAKFRGTNEHGSKRWKTDAKVVRCEPGRAFAFRVSAGPFGVADWSYLVEPSDGGCTVTEVWTDRRNGLTKALSKRISGVEDRAEHNRAGMEQTLERLARAVEA